MIKYTTKGPGDEETWPPCYGHQNDPRTEDLFSEGEGDEELDEIDDNLQGAFDWGQDDEDINDFDHEPSYN